LYAKKPGAVRLCGSGTNPKPISERRPAWTQGTQSQEIRQQIEFQAPEYLRNIIRIITETGLRVYKELIPMKKDQVNLENAVVWIPDSKTANGVAEVPLTEIAVKSVSGSVGSRWKESVVVSVMRTRADTRRL
jgi:integrase